MEKLPDFFYNNILIDIRTNLILSIGSRRVIGLDYLKDLHESILFEHICLWNPYLK